MTTIRYTKKMCRDKVSFTNKQKALKVAEKFGQNVYECPICFCFHCTNKDDWKDEFVPIIKYNRVVFEKDILRKKATQNKKLRHEVHLLNLEISRLKKLLKINKIKYEIPTEDKNDA